MLPETAVTAPGPEMRLSTLMLPVHGQSASRARAFALDVISGHPVDAENVRLAVSELITNALRAAARLAKDTRHPWQYDDTPVHIGAYATDRWTHLAARDPGLDEPVRRDPDELAETGRGIQILEAIAAKLWTTHGPHFKTVHAVLPAPDVVLTPEELDRFAL